MHLFEPHSLSQQRAILTQKKLLVLSTGTQWGKTVVGALRMKQRIHTYTSKNDNFLITAPSYKILKQSSLPAFLHFMQGYGEYNNQDAVFKLHTGGMVFCRTETDPDSVVGITNIRHIWCDEAGKYRLYFWENIQARADFCGCGIDLTTSPYSLNWIPKQLIKPFERGLRPDIEYITAPSWDNKYHSLHDEEKRAHKRQTMDARRFDMIYGGAHGKMAGLVYDCFDEDALSCESFPWPTGTKFYAGVDWGFTHPFVINLRAVTPSGHQFSFSEFYKTGLIISDKALIAKQKMKVFGIEKFIADPARPDEIEFFNREGLPTIPANNDIRTGVDAHYRLIKSGKYRIIADQCPHTIDEYSSYHYPEDEELGPDDDAKEQLPVDQNNHCMDVERYLTMYLSGRSVNKVTPKANDEVKPKIAVDHEKRIKQLKSNKGRFPGSENFS